MDQRRLLPAIVALLMLSACLGPGSPPLITLNNEGRVVEGLQSSYCWDGFPSAVCVDFMEPTFDTAIAWPAGTPLRLSLERPLPDRLTLSLSEQLFGDEIVSEVVAPAESVSWQPAVPPSTYVLSVTGEWRQGNVTYWFYLDLTP